EAPKQRRGLRACEIAQLRVTNALYAAFVAATSARPPMTWRGQTPPELLRDHPVVDVSWEEANVFCVWLNSAIGDWGLAIGQMNANSQSPIPSRQLFRLPTEVEWERAARGTDGRAFPWGETWDAARANTRESGLAGTTPPGAYGGGASAAGCLDMAGNVWEWTASRDALYPYHPDDGRENLQAQGRRILRGGCYANPHGFARCACRFR